ncbi:carbon-nitrogen hydrolase family protein [Streptomyces sp. NBC_00344]|uniref:carbon-nitrogen hydrolase family protein n=1 Tax=Streptomyces sp. NBC_00344 TaxID=2975720 RepID=UPI002E1DE35A
MRIALSQLTTGPDPGANLALVEKETRRAAETGARVVAFPEATMAAFGNPLAALAQPLDGPWADGVREIAAQHRVVVVAGMFTPAPDGKVTNTLLATGPGVEAAYDKIHLYDAFGYTESHGVAAGDRIVTFQVDGVRVGLATCYDIRFPELFRAHADAGAALTLLPASWGAGPGKAAQWDLLVRARALDATLWVAAVDQADPAASGATAVSGAPTGIGRSSVIGPDGTVRHVLGAEPGLLVGDIDADEVAAVRRSTSVLANRRLVRGMDGETRIGGSA